MGRISAFFRVWSAACPRRSARALQLAEKTSDEPAVSWVCNGYRNETTPGVCDREAYRVMDAKFVCFALIPRSRLDDCFWVYRIIFPGEFARLPYGLSYRTSSRLPGVVCTSVGRSTLRRAEDAEDEAG